MPAGSINTLTNSLFSCIAVQLRGKFGLTERGVPVSFMPKKIVYYIIMYIVYTTHKKMRGMVLDFINNFRNIFDKNIFL